MSRAIASVIMTATLAVACTSNHGAGKDHSSAAPSGTSTGPAATCSQASAKTARETLITTAGFNPSCVQIKAKAQFFFVNNEKKDHSVTTQKGSPESFDADLPKKTSTYTQIFNKKGTYVISDKTTGKTMTLLVS